MLFDLLEITFHEDGVLAPRARLQLAGGVDQFGGIGGDSLADREGRSPRRPKPAGEPETAPLGEKLGKGTGHGDAGAAGITFHAGIREDESVFRARLATFPEGFVVLRAAGDVRGYLCAERWSGVPPAEARYFALGHDPVPRHDPAGTALYLASMTVDPGLRGAGLGSRLLNEGASLIRGAAPGVLVELLVVNELWTGARRIYEAAGFSAYGVIDSFFARPDGKPSAGIAMRRPA